MKTKLIIAVLVLVATVPLCAQPYPPVAVSTLDGEVSCNPEMNSFPGDLQEGLPCNLPCDCDFWGPDA